MGIYSPTLGIIGAVIGLMAVHAESRTTRPSSGMASPRPSSPRSTASGSRTCSSCPWPQAQVVIQRQTQVREMVIEGLLAIAQGENPRTIESKLQGYLH